VFLSSPFLSYLAVAESHTIANLTSCHVIYDAGTSGTRLYIYQQSATGWVKHRGPGLSALADPVRRDRGKTMADADALTDSFVEALEGIRHDGPDRKNGRPRWQAFDWKSQCHLDTVAVFATAGMRLAEQKNPADAERLWRMLNHKLSDELGMAVTTRTLSGFEEGAFAWIATREESPDDQFGIAEMGDASAQLSFPCKQCKESRRVIVQGDEIALVSLSFLGMGQGEAWKRHPLRTACGLGVGLNNPQWQPSDCTDGIEIPLMIEQMGREVISRADVQLWYLSGAFVYAQQSDVENYCRNSGGNDFEPERACFRALYQAHFLTVFGIPSNSEASDMDLTLGAAICAANACFSTLHPSPDTSVLNW